VLTRSIYPRGCYYDSDNTAAFNTHAVGAGWSVQPLCALVTTGAPPPHAADARARVSTGARVPALRVYCALCIIMIQMAEI
jgi:hypothetical protein